MELREYLAVLRRRRTLAGSVFLVCVLGSVALTVLGPRHFVSTTTLFYSQASSSSVSTQDDQRLASYVTLVQSQRVATDVIARLRLDDRVDDVRDSLSAATRPGTLLVEVTATRSTPREARRVATVASNQLIRLSGDLEGGTGNPALLLAEPATPATEHSNLPRNLAFGILVGLFLGVVAAFVRETLDGRLRTEAQLAADHGVPTLASLRVVRDHSDAAGLIGGAPGPLDPAFRRLRLALQLHDDSGPHTVLLAACSPEAGAGTAAAGLAVTLARAGLDVVLVSAVPAPDATDAAPPDGPGLTDVVLRDRPLAEALGTTGHDKVWRIGPGGEPDYLDEVLASDGMTKLLARLRSEHHVVLVETPPLPESVSAALLGGPLGAGVVLVVRLGETRRDDIGAALELLAQSAAPVLGAVVTSAPAQPHVVLRPLTALWHRHSLARATRLIAATEEMATETTTTAQPSARRG